MSCTDALLERGAAAMREARPTAAGGSQVDAALDLLERCATSGQIGDHGVGKRREIVARRSAPLLLDRADLAL